MNQREEASLILRQRQQTAQKADVRTMAKKDGPANDYLVVLSTQTTDIAHIAQTEK